MKFPNGNAVLKIILKIKHTLGRIVITLFNFAILLCCHHNNCKLPITDSLNYKSEEIEHKGIQVEVNCIHNKNNCVVHFEKSQLN